MNDPYAELRKFLEKRNKEREAAERRRLQSIRQFVVRQVYTLRTDKEQRVDRWVNEYGTEKILVVCQCDVEDDNGYIDGLGNRVD